MREDPARPHGAPYLMWRGPGGRSGPGLNDSLRRLDAGTVLAALLLVGLLIRVFIAAVLLPRSGFAIDVGDFSAWGQRLASVGPAGFYDPGYFADYPPGYLYVLWLLGLVGGALGNVVGQDATGALVKIPGILADLGVAAVLFLMCRRWSGQLLARAWGARLGIDGEGLGLLAASVYLLNPGTIFNSAVWGQVDSVGALVLLLTIYALARGRTELAAVAAVAALLVKFQFAFLVPIVAIVGIKRHFFGRSSDPAHDGEREPVRVLTSLAVGTVALAVLLLPFGMGLYAPLEGGPSCFGFPPADPSNSLIGKFCEATNTYTGLTINAFNLWRNPWSGLGDTLIWGDDTVTGVTAAGLALTWQQVGTLLFAAVAILAFVQVARRDDLRGVLVASLLLAIAFFALPTRVHERYLFPAIALSAPLLLSGRVWPWVAGGVSLSFFANVYWVYTEDWSFAGGVMNPGLNGEPMRQPQFLTDTLFTNTGIWLLAAMILVVLAVVVWSSMRLALRPEGPDAEVSAAERVHRRAGKVRAVAPPAAVEEPLPPGPRLSWLTANPADLYLHEPPRRLDRRDALLLLALVAFALLFRLWRLELPRGQHFDEVYHARSATEFLSAWENGWDRDVYEWTHPMLAKYLIAGGILVADPNRIVDTRPLDRPSSALAVAPERRFSGNTRSIAFTLEASTTVVAWDAESGEEVARWEAGGPVGTLAYDADGFRLLVGRADDGTVETYELAGLLASPDGRAPPAGPPIRTELSGVNQIVVAGGAEPLLVRGPDGVAVVDGATDEVIGTADGAFAGVAYVAGVDENPDWIAVTDPGARAVRYFDATTLQPRADADGVEEIVDVGAPLIGPLLAVGGGDDQRLFALTGSLGATDEHRTTTGGLAAIDADGGGNQCAGTPCVIDLVPLPGAPSLIGWQEEAGLLYVAGVSRTEGPVLWTIEPHVERRDDSSVGLAAFDTTPLPGTPVAMAFDVATSGPEDDHGRLLVSTVSAGDAAAVAIVDAGSNAFAWRLAGVAFGAVLVGLVYLLAATMFSRRRIAVLAAAFVAIDGMSYAMSRISMNDIFVATLIVAAYALFWQIWSGRWTRSAWWALPLVGVLIGLAAATKWVGFYALAGLLILVLAKSALGRLVLVALAASVTVIGGIDAPWPFLVVMLGILAVALAVAYAKPIRLDLREAAVAIPATTLVLTGVVAPFLLAFDSVEGRNPDGAVEYLFGILLRGVQAGWPAWIMLGVAVVLIVWRGLLTLSDPETDARWYRPSEMVGFSWAWVGACLVIVPLAVYAVSYLPYLAFGHSWAIPETGPGYGWSVDELHAQMFGYHFNLQAGHDSASPWWSWPLTLKPTWFYNGSFDGNRLAVIYNGGNPILSWAGIPALAACAVLAWKRRSEALVLVVVAFALQFVPWIRIERATFAYHYLTAVIFAVIAVGDLVDELLRRPVWRSLAIGYLALVVVVGILIFPLGSALPVPDWYINAARALPPWNFGFQFPDPPTGDRAELVSVSALKAAAAGILAILAMAWAIYGRYLTDRWRRFRAGRAPEPATGGGNS
ncbi:MAG: phospholipid carrier-dependent glycosyltransferase [Chloroflexota bacterium]